MPGGMAHISRGEAQQARNVDDLSELEQRAYALRTCVHAFLADLGELAPVQKCLLDVLAEIDDHLQVLRGQDAESSAS